MDTLTLRLPLLRTRHWKLNNVFSLHRGLARGISFKNKAKLAKILIITELIGIAAMIWYLRVPLYQKFLAVKPKAYSLQAFSPDTRYLMSENDFLFGSTTPGYKVKLILTAGGQKRTVKASDQGNWVAQLPKNLPHKSYRLTTAYFDTQDKLSKVESFKVLVQSEAILFQSYPYRYFIRPLLPTPVQAAALKTTPSPKVTATPESKPVITSFNAPPNWTKEFSAWVNQAQSVGLYPYCEFNGQVDSTCNEASDILLTDYTTYANICQETVSCFIGSSAVTRINPQVDPVLIQSLARGEPIAYAAVASVLNPVLPIAPTYRNATLDLANTTVDPLNDSEQALLDERDGKTPEFKPYVEVINTPPLSN